jgi:hypothetical protein
MPFGHEVLIPYPKFLGIRNAGRPSFTPDQRNARTQRFIDHLGDRIAQLIFREETALDVKQILAGDAAIADDPALDAGVGSKPVTTEQKPVLKAFLVEILPGRGAVKVFGETDPERRFLEHVEQAGHRPAQRQVGFQSKQVRLPESSPRNMPDPIPVVLLGPLAVDRRYQQDGYASSLICFAHPEAVRFSVSVGCFGVSTHPLGDRAHAFYSWFGFQLLCSAPERHMIVRVMDLAIVAYDILHILILFY